MKGKGRFFDESSYEMEQKIEKHKIFNLNLSRSKRTACMER